MDMDKDLGRRKSIPVKFIMVKLENNLDIGKQELVK